MARPKQDEQDIVSEELDTALMRRVDRSLVGTTVGDYVIEEKLGEGGFGAVYQALHPMIGKEAAVKVLSRELSSDPDMVSRFVAEARAVNTIRHPNIIDIFNFGTIPGDDRCYFVMEVLKGLSLDGYLAQHGRAEPSLVCQVMVGVARALEAAHAADIIHRDLKPDNIFLHETSDGKLLPKLLDFGIAKLKGGARSLARHRTSTGAPLGTPAYMAPEQCLARDVDQRTDIYAFGVVCFEALTGVIPFDAPSLLELMNMHAMARICASGRAGSRCSRAITKVRCTPTPTARCASAMRR
jgi:serine/threonine-protein kinase